MTLMEQIQEQMKHLPPEKQGEVLDFVLFLQQRVADQRPAQQRSLTKHPAYGSWRGRKINSLQYEKNLRAEWDGQQ
jgi:hypothetical protein